MNFYGPLLLRSKLFLQKLQLDRSLTWDGVLSQELLREWVNICKQVNATPSLEFPRFVGRRDGTFKLVAFTDASRDAYGVVVYIQDCATNKVSFLSAKYRLINTKCDTKTIPVLEFQALCFGAELLVELCRELSGTSVVIPIKIEEYQIDTTETSTTATTQVAIHTFAAATFRSARFTIQVTNSTDSTYHTSEILLVHDGTTAYITEFGEIHTGTAEEATFDADINTGNVRLLATPASTDSMEFKVVCHSVTV